MKTNFAIGVVVCSVVAISLISASMGTIEWTRNKFNHTGDGCQGFRVLGLFNGKDDIIDGVGLQGVRCINPNENNKYYSIFDGEVDNLPVVILLYVTIVFCSLGLVFLLIALAVSAYNVVGKPYETYAGPIGLLLYLGLSALFVLISMFVYIGFKFTEAEKSVPQPSTYEVIRSDFGFSFYLLVVSFVPLFCGMVITFMSEKRKIKTKLQSRQKAEEHAKNQKDEMFMF